MKFNAVIEMLLLVAVLVGAAFASDEWNLTEAEDYTEQFLVKESLGIYDPEVEIADDLVTFKYTTKSPTSGDVWNDIDVILKTYWALVQASPETADLYVKVYLPSGNLAGTFSCKNDWVYGLDIENNNQMSDLYSKVARTMILKD